MACHDQRCRNRNAPGGPGSFLKRLEEAIVSPRLLEEGASVLIGVSGGADSMALMHGLAALAARHAWRLGIAHVNHGLRGKTADADEAFVCNAAAALGLACFHHHADVPAYRRETGLSTEEAARDLRHRFLLETAAENGFSAVALGHHRDDTAELLLMNLLRGSGPSGLSGMDPAATRLVSGESVRLIRPLLGFSRDEIEAFLEERDLPFVTDESNKDTAFLRNRIRHELLPLLAGYNPDIQGALSRLAEITRTEEEWLQTLIPPRYQALLLAEEDGRTTLDANLLRGEHPALRRRIVRHALARTKGDLRRIRLVHVDDVLTLLETRGGALDLPDRIRVLKERERLILMRAPGPLRTFREEEPSAPAFSYHLDGPGWVHVPELVMTVTAEVHPVSCCNVRSSGHQTAFFDMDTLCFPLVIRNGENRDRFSPLGMTGEQRLNKYFADHKIPAANRPFHPVLTSSGKVIWLVGCRIDDSVKVTEKTNRVLEIRVECGFAAQTQGETASGKGVSGSLTT